MKTRMGRFLPVLVTLSWMGLAPAQTAVTPPGTGTEADPYQVSQLGHLVWMGDNVGTSSGKCYRVQNDIDASATAGWNGGAGFAPIGVDDLFGPFFTGVFDGNGKVIRNLAINRPTERGAALFGSVGRGGVVQNLGLVGGSVKGRASLVGNNAGTVRDCYATGAVTGGIHSGVSGLVGVNTGTVIGCHATGAVLGGNYYVGGLVGWNDGTASDCYATGSVTGTDDVGGLIGLNRGTVSKCCATGAVAGRSELGGLVGRNEVYLGGGRTTQCYATGSVAGSFRYVGGLVGVNYSPAIVSECYATGAVTGNPLYIGGLVGLNGGTVGASYWDKSTSGQATSAGGTGKTTGQMKQKATFAGWDFAAVWRITENQTYPSFRPVTPGVANPISPAGGATVDNRRSAFTWSTANPAATWYHLWINRNGQTYLQPWVQGTTSWTPSADLPAGGYLWWVQTWRDGAYGPWSAGAGFSIPARVPGAILQTAPNGAQGSGDVTYRWQKDANATWYRLWVGRSGGGTWADRWYAQSGSGEGTATLAGHPAGSFTWWIRGWGPDGYGPWAGPMGFSTPSTAPAKPTLTAPSGILATQRPVFLWSSARAQWYRLQVRRGATVVTDQWMQTDSWTPASNLSPGAHSWWVAAWNSASGQTVWSDRMDFTVP